MRHLIPCLLLPFLSVGCTFDEGEPFGRLEASLEARYVVPQARVRPDGFAQLSSDLQLSISSFTVTTGVPSVSTLPPGAAALTFDPASPPPGYSSCHNGHCHGPGGTLVDYEDIALELAGGQSGAVVVPLHGGSPLGTVDLLAGRSGPLVCNEDCNLERLRLIALEMPVAEIALTGVLRDARTPPRFEGTLPFEWRETFPLEPTDAAAPEPESARAALDVRVERGEPVDISLRMNWEISPSLFDVPALVTRAVEAGGTLEVGGEDNAELSQLLTDRLTSALRVEVQR